MPAKSLPITSLLHPNPTKSVTKDSCAYLGDVELELLGKEDVDIRCTPRSALVSGRGGGCGEEGKRGGREEGSLSQNQRSFMGVYTLALRSVTRGGGVGDGVLYGF